MLRTFKVESKRKRLYKSVLEDDQVIQKAYYQDKKYYNLINQVWLTTWCEDLEEAKDEARRLWVDYEPDVFSIEIHKDSKLLYLHKNF